MIMCHSHYREEKEKNLQNQANERIVRYFSYVCQSSGCTALYCPGGHAFAREWNAAALRLQKTQPKGRRSTTGLRDNMEQYNLESGEGVKSNKSTGERG